MNRNLLLLMSKGVGFVAALFLLVPVCGYANTFNVTSTTDGNAQNELRGALLKADSLGGTQTINISAGSYVLTGGAITFGSQALNLTITGAGTASTFIESTSGSTADRIFIINTDGSIPNVIVSISGITFLNGNPGGDNFGGGAFICGGPGNSTTVTNCSFTNNTVQGAAGNSNGGAINASGGGALVISNCTFSNNSVPDGDGGAIIFSQTGPASSLSVTGCTFTGNSASSAEALLVPGGGAIFISINSATTAVSITGNTFVGNSTSGGEGGAIEIVNESSIEAFINYNRFYKNTAGQFPDLALGGGPTAAVDVTNNWWGLDLPVSPTSGTGPHAGLIGGGSTALLIATPYLELTCSGTATSLCGGSAGNSTVVTASFAKNSAGSTISSANLTALVGLPISFSSTQGTLSSAQTTIQSNGTATAVFTDNGVAGTDSVELAADSVTTATVLAHGKIVINGPSALASTAGSGTTSVGGTTPGITDGSCHQICLVTPSGASPVSGGVTGTVTIDATLQSDAGVPYLQRHYDIQPATGASTATGTITLYFLQSEFDTYNASVSNASLKLPASSTDNTGKANLTITQFHGTGTAPGNYTGWTGSGPATILITPGASNVVWNSVKSWWEVTFSVTGFSGFYVTGPMAAPLPVVLSSFTGVASGSAVVLSWDVDIETGLSRYEIQRSTDGVGFTTVGSAGVGSRTFFDGSAVAGSDFYRLRMVNIDGSSTYSQVVVVSVASSGSSGSSGGWVRVLGNPFHGVCSVVVGPAAAGMVSMRLADVSGVVLWRSEVSVGPEGLTEQLDRTGSLAPGVYFLTVMGARGEETIRVVKL